MDESIWKPAKQIIAESQKTAPQYELIGDHIIQCIQRGLLEPNQKFPSERQLGEKLELIRTVVRDVLTNLEAGGYIYRADRRGWFVSPPKLVYDPTSTLGFLAYTQNQGRTPHTKLISIQETTIKTEEMANNLGAQINDNVYLIKRLRGIDKRHILVERIYSNANLCPNLELQDLSSSYTNMIKSVYGLVTLKQEISLQPTVLKGDTAKQLQVANGTGGLLLKRISRNAQGEVTEYNEEFWRHDSIEIKFDIHHKD